MNQPLTTHRIVSVANTDNVRATARSLREYQHAEVTVVHVVEKAGSAPDKLPLEQAEELARESFAAFREVMPDVEVELVYDENVVGGIVDLAVEVDASAIAFQPRGESRLVQLLAGDKILKLVTKSDLPAIALTDTDMEGS
ncbi:universal stress protein [Halobacteriales archaeon SW_8_68_21]|nr:MAG: universal stress protein [Halobacteriales archaeon SW_8_68_21]